MGTTIAVASRIQRRKRTAKQRGPAAGAPVVSPVVSTAMASRPPPSSAFAPSRCSLDAPPEISGSSLATWTSSPPLQGPTSCARGRRGRRSSSRSRVEPPSCAAGGRSTSSTPGAHFGELALLDPAPRAVTVQAITPMLLAALGHRMFKVLLREVPALAAQLLASLAAELRDARADAGRLTAPGRPSDRTLPAGDNQLYEISGLPLVTYGR